MGLCIRYTLSASQILAPHYMYSFVTSTLYIKIFNLSIELFSTKNKIAVVDNSRKVIRLNPNFKRKIKKEIIASKALMEEKEFLISFPPDYTDQQQYPVLMLHDGDDYFYMGRIVTQANALIHQGRLRPFLIIGIPVDKKKRNQEYSPLGSRHQQHLQFLAEELIPTIQQQLPTADFSPENWVIGGSSLGGTVSIHFALTYPGFCRQVLLQSCAFLEPTMDQIKKAISLQSLHLYQSVGKNETSVPTSMGSLNFLSQNRHARRLLMEKQATVHYVEAEGEHNWRLWQEELPNALHYFFHHATVSFHP